MHLCSLSAWFMMNQIVDFLVKQRMALTMRRQLPWIITVITLLLTSLVTAWLPGGYYHLPKVYSEQHQGSNFNGTISFPHVSVSSTRFISNFVHGANWTGSKVFDCLVRCIILCVVVCLQLCQKNWGWGRWPLFLGTASATAGLFSDLICFGLIGGVVDFWGVIAGPLSMLQLSTSDFLNLSGVLLVAIGLLIWLVQHEFLSKRVGH